MKKAQVLLVLVLVIVSTGTAQLTSDTTTIGVQLKENGDAEWSFLREIPLENEVESAAFREYKKEYKRQEDEKFQKFKMEIETLIDEISLDREMRVTNFNVSFSTEENKGYIIYSFLWTNFARVENGKLLVGDVFEGGYYLSENETLKITIPEGYTIASVQPDPTTMTDDAVSWEGKLNFNDGNPQLVLEKTDAESIVDETAVKETPRHNEKYLYLGFGIVILLVVIIFVVLLK